MKAIDTNVIARYVMADDAEQASVATAILAQPCFIAVTVLLETAWLLSTRYGMDRATLAATLSDLTLLPTVTMTEPDLVTWAIGRFAAGADLADMLHIAASRGADAFISFEKRLATLAGPDAPLAIEQAG